MKKKIAIIALVAAVIGAIFFLLNLGNKESSAREIGIVHLEIEDMPANVQEYLNQYRMSEAYKAFSYDNELYLFASRGEQSQEGYSLVLKDAFFDKGILTVTAEKRDPEEGASEERGLNYPYKLVKMADNTVEYKKVIFKDTAGKVLAQEEIQILEVVPETIIELYFGTEDGYFRKEKRSVPLEVTAENASIVVEELIKGPEKEGNLAVLPWGTELLSYQYDPENKLATIDLGGSIRDVAGSAGEIFAVYSLVNSLTEIEGIDKVQILINGQVVESLAGHIYLGDPLSPDYSFLEDNKYK